MGIFIGILAARPALRVAQGGAEVGLITEKTPLAGIQPVKFLLNWGRKYSLWVFNFGLACCAIEFIAASTSKHDFIRFGVIPFAHGPRQADLHDRRRARSPTRWRRRSSACTTRCPSRST